MGSSFIATEEANAVDGSGLGPVSGSGLGLLVCKFGQAQGQCQAQG